MAEDKDLVNEIILGIETTLTGGKFRDNENSIVELKDLSTGKDWVSLKETVCAYLNTNGGYIICGIREKDKNYTYPGFNRNNEGGLIELQTKFFKNDHDVLINLSENILFDYKYVLEKTLAVITVLPLSEDLKYVKFEGHYYERILASDRKIPQAKLLQHIEYKSELEYSKEIRPQENASIDNLDVDKINQFIIRINSTGKKETLKKDIIDAKDFLSRKYCINSDGKITVLGLLLFAKDPFQYLEYRSTVDCYFETGTEIGRDKKYFQNDVLNLMDESFSFVWGHIKVGRSYIGGGRSEPEFPEKLVREIVNNALAHRDYTINKFITIKINPGKGLEIKNPGTFKQKMLIVDTADPEFEIRRILPGVAESKNPKLANVLKAFEKIESQGIGMATLVSVCLENQIDVPYYDLSTPDTISLIVPTGTLIDDKTQRWMDSFYGYISEKLNGKMSREHELVLAYLLKSEQLNQKRLYTILLSSSNNHFDVIHDLRSAKLITAHISSTEQIPIYVLDKELKVTDFTNHIEAATGKEIKKFDATQKKVLNIIYRYNAYNKQPVKPNIITPELYFDMYGKEIDPIAYESLGRRVRKIFGDLLKADMLNKLEDKSYEIKRSIQE